jgi:hypothetical protein
MMAPKRSFRREHFDSGRRGGATVSHFIQQFRIHFGRTPAV